MQTYQRMYHTISYCSSASRFHNLLDRRFRQSKIRIRKLHQLALRQHCPWNIHPHHHLYFRHCSIHPGTYLNYWSRCCITSRIKEHFYCYPPWLSSCMDWSYDRFIPSHAPRQILIKKYDRKESTQIQNFPSHRYSFEDIRVQVYSVAKTLSTYSLLLT